MNSPYRHELQALAEQPSQDILPGAQNINEVLRLMHARALDAELQVYRQRIAQGEKLSDEEKQLFLKKQRQRHESQKKRGQIFNVLMK